MRAQVLLPASLESTTAARRFAEDTLAAWGLNGERYETARLLVSELVANATIHAATAVDLVLDLSDDRLRVDVGDTAGGRPALRSPGPDDPTGRGLLIVDAMADRWGVDEVPPGKTVWFELDTRPAD